MSKSSSSDHTITERLSETAQQSMEQMGKVADKTKQRLHHDAVAAKASAKQMGRQAKKHSEQALDSVNGFIGDNPLTSVGIAFAAGTLVSHLIKR